MMRMIKRVLGIGAALALVTGPVTSAAASPTSKLSLSNSTRVDAKLRKNASDLRGGSTVVAVGAALLVAGLVVLIAGGGSNSP